MMATSSRRKRSFDVAFKLKVIAQAEENGKSATAKSFGIERKSIQVWCKQKEQLLSLADPVTGKGKKRKRLDGGGRKAAHPRIEDRLYQWICELREKRLRVTRKMVTTEALRLYAEMDGGSEGR